MSIATKANVESAVHSLNEKMERLGWLRRYRFVKGNNSTGVQHVLETLLPHLVHPAHREPIGSTLSKAHQYLAAMAQVLNDALAERERQRAVAASRAMTGAPVNQRTLEDVAQEYPGSITFTDPDARSATRPQEGFREGRPIF